MSTIEDGPVPYPPTRKTRRRLSPQSKAIAGFATYFIAALSMFGAMILLSLL